MAGYGSSHSTSESLAAALINHLKVSAGFDKEANALAGRLEHWIYDKHSTQSVGEYLDVFKDVLDSSVVKFLADNEENLDVYCSLFKNSPAYERLITVGVLSAKRLFDTYVLRACDVRASQGPPFAGAAAGGSLGPGAVYESVTHFFMRIAAFCACQCMRHEFLRKTIAEIQKKDWGERVEGPMELFDYFFKPLSRQLVCCATPVMRSAGVKDGNLASCFIYAPDLFSEERTAAALFHELSALLAVKSGVGIDITRFSHEKNVHNCLKLMNAQVEYYNDHNPRPVSVAAYIELWHFQIQEFLASKLPETQDRCASIFQGLCIPGLFFETYLRDPGESWYLFDPAMAGNLSSLHGEEFNREYARLVAAGAYSSKVSAKSLMFAIINTIIKTGSPYIILKEACNRHYWRETQGGAIAAANLCAEVIQHPGDVVSTCNLANICLPKCLVKEEFKSRRGRHFHDQYDEHGEYFSMEVLHKAVQVATFVVNAAIVGGRCPTEATFVGQMERSMGIGVHGLADVFARLRYEYIEDGAAKLDVRIFENMYFKAVETSHRIVLWGGGTPFKGWEESKLSKGVFHWEGWKDVKLSIPAEQWNDLRRSIVGTGVFNSQYVALMPTTGSSQLTGYNESYYPFYANISSKVSNKEEVMRPNAVFLEQLCATDLKTVRFYGGDVWKFPDKLRAKYRYFLSAFDYSPREQLIRARERAPFIDHSQSHSFFLNEASVVSARYIKDLLVLGYQLGLKTIMYYCRVKKETNLGALECLEGPESNGVIKTPRCSRAELAGYNKETRDAVNECESCQ
ncbi:ribonucleotide reductase subunit 1 [Common bottlenose dolphin gammaherpesvirus 1 strain Sarasota]|uniref:Ribonucleoside-diphosphate reductase large subunit n=1 Tax=Common bottlenose dolphin gammaherpesvirus 1 strain Sarasota TaxID=2022783 RepID=A0A1Z1NEK3_9GAMA|nr:ribonucleotide reductase subunit 1 [Common bottlenose dolphin gammaherpesvirus 1 strain Sarasota]ARW78123.1 ribonucleotide reductase subunit 1 [Common bottlenose dolphin gammaherpesvirus 1 strain Sarasota]